MAARKLNLLYLSPGYTTHDQRFLQSFRDADCRVSHLRLVGESLDRRPLPQGVSRIDWVGDRRPLATPLDYLHRWRSLRSILARQRPDVVLAGPVPTSAFLVAMTGFAPLVSMSWGSDLLVDVRKNRWARAAATLALRRSQGVFGDCQTVAQAVRALARFADDRLVMFPWGIERGRFSPGPSRLDLRTKLGWTGKPVLISTRSWEPVYALDVLLRAFSAVLQCRSDARLLLLGDGSQAPALRALIDRMGLEHAVFAPGRVPYDSLPDYFRLADVYVSATLSDGTSISLLEAMACGLPVVVTNGYGNLEWVSPGRNGWLAAASNHESLARALLEALSFEPSRLAEMKKLNAETACSRANWEENFPRLLDLLRRVAHG